MPTPPPERPLPAATRRRSRPTANSPWPIWQRQLGIAATTITVRSVEAVDWPDASLACPQPGMMYAQVITPGYRIVLEVDGKSYEYHTGGGGIVRCVP